MPEIALGVRGLGVGASGPEQEPEPPVALSRGARLRNTAIAMQVAITARLQVVLVWMAAFSLT